MLPLSFHHWLDELSANALRSVINFWPPFLGMGIKIETISEDFRRIDVKLTLHWYNKNYVGTHFGGGMLAMTDPFYMLILLKNLGKNYIVWDKATQIDFKKVGKGILRAHFHLSEEQISSIRATADTQEKYIFDLPIDITNEAGEIVASVQKTLYVRKKV